MAMTIHCDIVSAEKEIYSGLVELVVAHGSLGDLGVAYGHAPLLSSLNPGPVRITKQNGEEEIFYVSGGFLEVQPGTVSILADSALRADDIDEAAALEAQRIAEEEIANVNADMDYGATAARLAEAAAQLRAIQQLRNIK